MLVDRSGCVEFRLSFYLTMFLILSLCMSSVDASIFACGFDLNLRDDEEFVLPAKGTCYYELD